MKASEFREFNRVWEMNAVDQGSPVVTFLGTKKGTYVIYEGLHSLAYRRSMDVHIDGLKDDMHISVSGKMLSGIVSILPDDGELSLALKGTQLVLRCSTIRNRLTYALASTPPDLSLPEAQTGSVIIKSAELAQRLSVIGEVASKRMNQIILTGVNLSINKRKTNLVIKMADGMRAAVSSVSLVEGVQIRPFDTTAPIADLRIALGLMGEACSILVTEKALVLTDGDSFVRMALVQGAYPDLSALAKIEQTSSALIPSTVFTTIERAASLIDSNKIVHMEFKRGHLVVSTESKELGDFHIDAGDVRAPDGGFSADATYLAIVGRFSDSVRLSYTTPVKQPVLFEGGGYRYWLSPIATRS